MPSYRDNRYTVRQAVLARLESGLGLTGLRSGEAGLPCQATINNWMRADPAFAEAVAAARAKGEARRRRLDFDPQVAAEIVRRRAEGETMAAIATSPGMPSLRTVELWRANQGPFAEAMWRVGRERRVEVAARARAARRRTPFDPAAAERLYVRLWTGRERLRAVLASDPAFPSWRGLERWRRENPAFDAQMRMVLGARRRQGRRKRCLCTAQTTAVIAEAVRQGRSLRRLGRQPGMPSASAMRNWMRERPEFAEAIRQARAERRAKRRRGVWEGLPPILRPPRPPSPPRGR